MIARILLALLVLSAAFLAARGLDSGLRRRPAEDQYRPRRGRASSSQAPRATRAVVRRHSLAQLRDALTGGPLDADDELFRCADCQSFYGVASVRALATDNQARCINCGSVHRIAVEVVD